MRATRRSWPRPSRGRRRTASPSAPIRAFPTSGASGAGGCRSAPPEIERLVAYQIGAAQALAAYAGHRITYVKAHGALANLAAAERAVADAIARAVRAVDRDLALLAIALTAQVPAGEAAGLEIHQEIFADRGYTEDGQLIARGRPGAMIEGAEEAAGRVLAMVESGAIVTAQGTRLPTPIRSVCVHGDSAHAVATARAVRDRLEGAGIRLAPFRA